MDCFSTPATQQRFELEIKRSRFITTAVPVSGKASALAAISAIREEMPDANHHCWAMVAGPPDDIYQQDQSDDGEPRGTAGKPMLNVLLHSGLGNIVVVVSRYFGGTKLGTGGLVRAYSQSVSQALSNLHTVSHFIRLNCQVELAYTQLDTLEHWLKETDILVVDRVFSDKVLLTLAAPESASGTLKEKIGTLGGRWIKQAGSADAS